MKSFYQGNSNKSGTYKIVNLCNSRQYFGSAKCFKVRLSQHVRELRAKRHKNAFLQNDFNKCGEDAFEFHIVEVVEGSKEQRLNKEKQLLENFYDNQKQCYNLTKSTISREGCKDRSHEASFKRRSAASKATMSDLEMRKRISEAHKKRLANPKNHPMYGIKGEDNPRFGMKHTEETKKKIAEASRGNKNCLGKPVPKEVRQKISRALKGRKLSEEVKERMRMARMQRK